VFERGLDHRVDRAKAGGSHGLRQDPNILVWILSRRGNQQDSSVRRGFRIRKFAESGIVDEPDPGFRRIRAGFFAERVSENLKCGQHSRREASCRQSNVDLSADRTIRRRHRVHTLFFGTKFFFGEEIWIVSAMQNRDSFDDD